MKCAIFLLALCVFQAGDSAIGGPTAAYTPRKETQNQFKKVFKPINDNYWNAVKAIKPNLKRTKKLTALMDKCLQEANDKNAVYKQRSEFVEHQCDQFFEAAEGHSHHHIEAAEGKCISLINPLIPQEQENAKAAVTCVKKCLQTGGNCK